jgi:putative addiction module CopG family antidote
MSANLSPEVNQLIAQELALGHYRSEEELLTEAVHLLTQRNALREREAAAIQEGIDDMEAGRVMPLRDFDREFRQRVRMD